MDYVVSKEIGHARGDIFRNFFGHVMCGFERFALDPPGSLTPKVKRVKASLNHAAFCPKRQDGHGEFSALISVVMIDVDACCCASK